MTSLKFKDLIEYTDSQLSQKLQDIDAEIDLLWQNLRSNKDHNYAKLRQLRRDKARVLTRLQAMKEAM